MTAQKRRVWLNRIERFSWAGMLLALPVTSFPFFPPSIGGDALVRPLSVYPMLVLFFLSVLPRLVSRPIPRTVQPLFLFALIAFASSILSLLRGIEPALGISVNARVLRGIITLLIGCGIYLTIALLPDSPGDLRFSLRWMYTGGAIALFWGSLQAINILKHNPAWFSFLENTQKYISIRALHNDRIYGLTYEPHWFADQIIVLLLPWLLAAVISGYSAFLRRWRWLTIELILSVWCIVLMPFTFSRAGIFNMVLLSLFAMFLFWHSLQRGGMPLWLQKFRFTQHMSLRVLRYLIAGLVLIGVMLPIYLIGARNSFFSRIWEYWKTHPETSLTDYMSYLGFDARLTYSQAAFQTYLNYPVLGVGLGNYAFYFEEMLPYRPIAEVPEALFVMTPQMGRDRLITSKNLYLRLLAETGILGTIAFLAFFIANIGCALYLWFSMDQEKQYWGTASLCALVAFMLSALTFDSFVIPNMWVVFGMLTAATRVFPSQQSH